MAKKTVKTENINAAYKYEGDGKLIMDRPSKPLIKTNTIKEVETVIESVTESKKILYTKLTTLNEPFILKYMGDIIFDSSVDNIDKLEFQDDIVFCKGLTIKYSGLSLKFKK